MDCLGRSYNLDIIVRYKSCRLIFIVGASFLFSFPPTIIVGLFDDVKQISLGDGELALRLWLVVIKGPIHPEKPHGDVECPSTQAILDRAFRQGLVRKERLSQGIGGVGNNSARRQRA